MLVRTPCHLTPQVAPVTNLAPGSCYLLLGEPDIIRPESSGRSHHEAPVADSGRGSSPRFWRGFRGIGAATRGTPELLTGEPRTDPQHPRICPQTLSLSVNPEVTGLTAREPNRPRGISGC
jgi:hypothetical protein